MTAASPIPAGIVCAADYETLARAQLDPALLAHLDGGAGDEISLRANRAAFARHGIFNRVLCDLRRGSTRLTLLGQRLRHPILLAPVAYQRLFDTNGEVASARAAVATDSAMVLSTLSSCTLEEVAAQGPAHRWFQLYLQSRRSDSEALLRRAEHAGYAAIVLTLDTPVQSPPRRAQRQGFCIPLHVDAANLRDQAPVPRVELEADDSLVFQGWMSDAPRWDDLEWLLRSSRLPVLVKGVSHPADAVRLAAAGVAGIVVSNHGGRALDGVPATLDLLPAIRRSVGDALPLLLDGGIRSGSDVFKALASGANAVLVGRLAMHALAVAGDAGVAHLLRLLRDELELTMALAGCAELTTVDAQALAALPGASASSGSTSSSHRR